MPKLGYIFGMSENIKTTILIVDDNQDAADTLAILIRNAGHEALVAYDTESGIALANTSLPDFIFYDTKHGRFRVNLFPLAF